MLNLWEIPAGSPPAGKVSNFINPYTQGSVLAIGIYIFLPLMILFAVTRIYARAIVTRIFGLNDGTFCAPS